MNIAAPTRRISLSKRTSSVTLPLDSDLSTASPSSLAAMPGTKLGFCQQEKDLTWFRTILHFWVPPLSRIEVAPTTTPFVLESKAVTPCNTTDQQLRTKNYYRHFLQKKELGAQSREIAEGQNYCHDTSGNQRSGTPSFKPACRQQSEAKNRRAGRTFIAAAADDTAFAKKHSVSAPPIARDCRREPTPQIPKIEAAELFGFDGGNWGHTSTAKTAVLHGSQFGISSVRPPQTRSVDTNSTASIANCSISAGKRITPDAVWDCSRTCSEFFNRNQSSAKNRDREILPTGDDPPHKVACEGTRLTTDSTRLATTRAKANVVSSKAKGYAFGTQSAIQRVQDCHPGRKLLLTHTTRTSFSVSSKDKSVDHSLGGDTYRCYQGTNHTDCRSVDKLSNGGIIPSPSSNSVSVLVVEFEKDVDLGRQLCFVQSPTLIPGKCKVEKKLGKGVDLGRFCQKPGQVKRRITDSQSAGHITDVTILQETDFTLPGSHSGPSQTALVNLETSSVKSMIPVGVSESVAIVKVPSYAERSVESAVHFKDMRRHKSTINFEPTLAPVRFADTLILYGKNSTRKRYVSRTFYEPRVKPKKFGETDFVFSKDKTQSFASYLDYHIDECRKWFKTCMELRAKTFTTVHNVLDTSALSSRTSTMTSDTRRGVMINCIDDVGFDGPGASQVFIPPYKLEDKGLGEKQFRVALHKDKVDINMNGPIANGL